MSVPIIPLPVISAKRTIASGGARIHAFVEGRTSGGTASPRSPGNTKTVGYVIHGSAELHLEGQTLLLNAGDSWVVPKGAKHTYKILES